MSRNNVTARWQAAHGIGRLLADAFEFAVSFDGSVNTQLQIRCMRERIERELPELLLRLVA